VKRALIILTAFEVVCVASMILVSISAWMTGTVVGIGASLVTVLVGGFIGYFVLCEWLGLRP
jgi:hypothetical protein